MFDTASHVWRCAVLQDTIDEVFEAIDGFHTDARLQQFLSILHALASSFRRWDVGAHVQAPYVGFHAVVVCCSRLLFRERNRSAVMFTPGFLSYFGVFGCTLHSGVAAFSFWTHREISIQFLHSIM